jgi:hypothetical protein
MIGSISKVRPCAHSHYYKYSHAKTHDDLLHIEPNIKYDYDSEGTFEFSLNNLTTLKKTGIFYNTKLKKIKAETPNLTTINTIIGTERSLEEIEINWENVTNCTSALQASALVKMPENFHPNTTNLSSLLRFVINGSLIKNNNYTIPYCEAIDKATDIGAMFEGTINNPIYLDERYTFENVKNGGRAFYNTWGYNNAGFTDDFSKNLNFKNLEGGDNMFLGHAALSVINSKEGFPKLKTATNMFYHAPLKDFCPDTDFGLPSLTDGTNMFSNSQFRKDSAHRILRSLPTYESGTHKLAIGISGDLRYDEETARLLKECDNTYTPVLETLGILDPSTITVNKGWTLTVTFRGNSTYDEVLHPVHFEPKLEMNLELPEGYARLRYLECDGTQYINTDYIPTGTTGMWGILKTAYNANDGNFRIFAGSVAQPMMYIPSHTGNNSYLRYGYGSHQSPNKYNDNFTHAEVSLNWLNSKQMYLKQNYTTTHTANITTTLGTCTYPLYIFGANNKNSLLNGVSGYGNGIGRMYRFKISEGSCYR